MQSLKLGFHGTFALKKEDIIKILKVASEDSGLSHPKDVLMSKTGLGNEKVLRIKSWAVRSGLVLKNFLSPEGQIIMRYDPYLDSPITDWVMHLHLCCHKNVEGSKTLYPPPTQASDWGGWSYFVFDFLSNHDSFKLENLIDESSKIFKETKRLLSKNFRILIRAYVEEISGCGFLRSIGNDEYECGRPDLSNPYTLMYILAKVWERDFPNSVEVFLTDMMESRMGIASILGVQNKVLLEELQRIQELGIIEIKKENSRQYLLKKWTNSCSCLEQAYQ